MGPKGNPPSGLSFFWGCMALLAVKVKIVAEPWSATCSFCVPRLEAYRGEGEGERRRRRTRGRKPRSFGVRRSGVGVGGSAKGLGLGTIALVALTRKMFRTGRGETMGGGQGKPFA